MPTKPTYFQTPEAKAVRAVAGDRHRQYNKFSRDPALLKFYSSAPWRRFRASVRATRILCERCRKDGRFVPGTQVHHQIDPRVDPLLALDESNVELLCHSCHSRETASAGRTSG